MISYFPFFRAAAASHVLCYTKSPKFIKRREGCEEETAPQREVKEGDEGKTEIDREQESAEERAALLSKSPAKINPLRGENKTSCEIKLWHRLSKNDATFICYSQVLRLDGKVVLAVAQAPPPPCRHTTRGCVAAAGSAERDT